MSEKFISARNSCSISPLRSSNFHNRVVNPSKSTSRRNNNGAKKNGEKLIEDKKIEGKNSREGCREEFGANTLNLTLVGSPAPRSQVRALVSSTNLAAKSKAKPSYGQKSRDQNPHEICMEKLYQFADNPTKFVRLENREEPQLAELDLEFSDRSEESENFYNSHNIAFGENGEYRIPEYDHIRFLQFSIGDNRDSRISSEDRDNNTSVSAKFERSIATSDQICDRFVKGNKISTIPDAPETQRSADSPEATPQIDQINPWNSKTSRTSSWPKNNGALEIVQSHPLGSAINYKNNINPEVEKFMLLDTGLQESPDENYGKSSQNNRLIDESILSKNFTQGIRIQPFEGSGENSSRTSPVTSRTTLSQASSVDGTWHGHSLNSPYFASVESNSWTGDSKRNGEKDLSKVQIAGYDEEADEYLTIVKNEGDSSSNDSSEKGGVQKYIFITNQFLGSSELLRNDDEKTEDADDRCRDSGKIDKSLTRLSETGSALDNSLTKTDRSTSTGIFYKVEENFEKDISSGAESSSDYFIRNIFSRSSSSRFATSSSSSSSCPSSSSTEDVQPKETETSFSPAAISLENKSEENNIGREVAELNLPEESLTPKVLYMTLEEVSLAADYSRKLSDIFNRVLKRSDKDENRENNKKEVNVSCSNLTDITTQNTPKLIYTCLQSSSFCTSHLSS